MKTETKSISFNYFISEGIELEVNAVCEKNGEVSTLDAIKEILKDELAFAEISDSIVAIPMSGFYCHSFYDKYKEKLKELGCTFSYNGNVSYLSIIFKDAQPYQVNLKSIMFNNQNILPILEVLKSLDKILDAALEETKNTFEQ